MLALKIAVRYLVARKSHNAVNIIAWVAVLGVTVAAAAMMVVLSVFNGFSQLAEAHLSRLDPQLLVTRTDGRVIDNADSLAAALQSRPDVALALPTLSHRALAVAGNTQTAVIYKGVPAGYEKLTQVDSVIIDGSYVPSTPTGQPTVQLSVGVANALLVRPGTESVLDLYVPRRRGRINPANPAASFRGQQLTVSGVYQVQQNDLDMDRVIIPLDVARYLLQYEGGEGTAIELKLAPNAPLTAVQQAIAAQLGPQYRVADRLEQRGEAFRMIEIEKWITFMMLIFVLVIALFNIVSTVSLLIIEKRDNMLTLRALGAPMSMIRRIFSLEAWLITLTGGVAGTALGLCLAAAQERWGLIKLGADPSVVTVASYPVQVRVGDTLIVLAAVAATGLLTALTVRLQVKRI